MILYLKEVWSVQSSEKFGTQTYRKLERLAAMPTGRKTSKEFVYIYKLDRKNALFFSLEDRISPEVNTIDSLFRKIKQRGSKNPSFPFLKNRFPISVIF